MAQRRIVLLGIDRLLADLIKAMVEADDDIAVVAELDADSALEAGVEATAADFVIAALDAQTLSEPYMRLLERRPCVKLLAIADDGGTGTLWELRPKRTPLGELSSATLLRALRMPDWTRAGVRG